MTDHHMTHMTETGNELDLVVCPDCSAPAEVVDRFTLPSTDGPAEHVKVRCLHRHWFVLLAATLPTARTLDALAGTGWDR